MEPTPYTYYIGLLFEATSQEMLDKIRAEYEKRFGADPQGYGAQSFYRALEDREEEMADLQGMPPVSEQQLVERLQNEFGYSQHEARAGAWFLLRRQYGLYNAVVRWYHTGELIEVEREGFRLGDLVEKYGFTPPSAICLLIGLPIEGKAMRTLIDRRQDPISALAASVPS